MEAILEEVMRSPRLPLLVDELTEFLRRETEVRREFRTKLADEVRAEFINGEVIETSPACHSHSNALALTGQLISLFVQVRVLGKTVIKQALTGFDRNDYAPDLCYWGREKAASIVADTAVFPVPDFICEVVSPSTEARDRGVKFEDYATHGVGEYWLIDADERVVEQYVLVDGRYELLGKWSAGTISSRVIEGLVIPIDAMFDDDANVLATRALLA